MRSPAAALKSKVAKVLPGGSPDSDWCRWMALRPLGDLEFQQGAEQAGGGPAFPIGDRDVMLPVARDAGQAQGGEQTGQDRGVDRVGHDSTAMRPAWPSKAS